MKNKKLILLIFSLLFIILTACQPSDNENTTNSEERTENDSLKNIDGSNNVADQESVDLENPEIDNETPSNVNESDSSGSKDNNGNIKINSGEEAVQFLKQQLEEGKNEDISFGTDGILLTDENGSYYTIQLVDIPLRVSGKTGNLGYYKVYEDGSYGILQINSLNEYDKSHNLSEYKDEFLQKLDTIKKELEEAEEHSEGTTTNEMEKVAENRFNTWDKELNVIYGFLQDYLKKEDMDILREQQREWITYKEEMAKEESLQYKGGSMESVVYMSTLAELTMNKCYELVHMYMN